MKYTPTSIPTDASPGLRAWLAQQFRQLANALAEPSVTVVRFDVLHAEPDRRADGDLVFADGTDWNPGSGAGLYERRGSAWHKL